jgi:hypothetical protein
MATHTEMQDFISGIEFENEAVHSLVQDFVLDTESDQLPALRPEAPAPWHPRLPFDIALNEEPDILCTRYNITKIQLDELYFVPSFRREVADHQVSIRENGVTFKQKARVQAEMYLEVLDDIVNDSTVSAATKLDAIKSVVKWGDLEPKETKGANVNAPQFNIQINL